MEPTNTFRVVKIAGKGVMTILDTFDDRDVAQVWVDGYTAGGGLARKGKSETAPRIEIWANPSA